MIQGRTDESVLTDKGIADAAILGKAIQGLAIDAFYCSPLQRAHRTAQIIHEQLPETPAPQAHPLLLEINLPLWEKMKKEDVKTQYPEEYRLWHEHPDQLKMTLEDGRDYFPIQELYAQAQDFWREVLPKHAGQTIAIVAHNGINRCLIMSAIAMVPGRYQSIQQSNCCINVLNFSGGLGDPVQIESLNQTAHLGQPLPEPRPGHRGPRMLLIRHGETQWNRESRFQGIRDIPLNDNGRAQAAKAQDFLREVALDFAYTSPMARPKETAEIILQGHPQIALQTDDRLMEISHGLWEGLLESEIEGQFPGMLDQWKIAPETVQMPEGENLQQVWDRSIAAWEELVQRHSNDEGQVGMVVAHDAINKVVLCHLLGLQPANFWNVKQGNCAVTVIDYSKGPSGYPVIQSLNITTHLSGSILDKTAAGAL